MKSKPNPNYQIDQSGKIEQTNWPTIVILSNGQTFSIKISGVEKRKLIKILIELDRPKKNYSLKIFSALIYILIVKLQVKSVTIDQEYKSHSRDIENMILQLLRNHNQLIPEIRFDQIGKKSRAHILGISVFRNKSKPDLTLTSQNLLKILYGSNTKKGRRSQSSRDNP